MTAEATSLRSLFFDSPAEAAATLARTVGSAETGSQIRGALVRMPDAAKRAVLDEVGREAAGLLEMDVTDVFRQAWTKHTALREAAAATAADPDTEQIVDLVGHTASFTYDPAIEVQVADLPVATIGLRVELEVRIRGLLAVVRRGRLTAIRAGSATGTGILSIADQQVTKRQVNLNLPLVLRLRDGIPITEEVRSG